MIKYLHDEDFEELVREGTVLVDFYAEWCGPCKMMGSILETMDINIVKVNTDEHPELARNFGIMNIPTLVLFKDGSNAGKLIGLQSREDIENFVNQTN